MAQVVVKRKIKKGVIYFFAGIITIIVLSILGINYYNDYKYRQTNEYKLLEKGYTSDETNLLLEKLGENKIDELINQEKNELIIPILSEKYYIAKNLEIYLEYYKENPEKSTYDIVALVNTKAYLDWYEEIKEADTSKGDLILVNKFNQLPEDYTPENLTKVSVQYSYGDQKITKEAYDAFIDMYNSALKDDIKLIINSSYRDYTSQKNTYTDLKNAYGTSRADGQAARPGHSEHESGLAFDIFSPGNTSTSNFKDSNAYTWLKEHAQEYGFIERYPEGKEYITGYNFESWHWRYVGKEAAITIKEEEITFDEYYAYYIENQN